MEGLDHLNMCEIVNKNENSGCINSAAEDIKNEKSTKVEAESEKSVLNEKSYSIYNYLIKTPSILIAIVSGLLAIISFLINYAVYKQNVHYLQYWNVDPSVISNSNKQLFYTFCISIVFLLISTGVSAMIASAYSNNTPIYEYIRRSKIKLSELKKKNAVNIKACRLLKKSYIKHPASTNEEFAHEIENNEYYKSSKDLLIEINRLKKDLSKYRKKLQKPLWRRLITAYIILFISVIVYMLVIINGFQAGWYKGFISVFFITTVQFIFNCLINRLTYGALARKRIKENPNSEEVFSKLDNELSEIQFPFEKLSKHGIKSLFSNVSIIIIIIGIIITAVFLNFAPLFDTSARMNKQFKCVTIDEVQYISVYTDAETMVLEKVEIDDGKVIVYTKNQMIVPTKGINYEVISFESVERIE